jgi:hypothetical protein
MYLYVNSKSIQVNCHIWIKDVYTLSVSIWNYTSRSSEALVKQSTINTTLRARMKLCVIAKGPLTI